MAPVLRKSAMKKSASSKVIPMAANTTAKLHSVPQHLGLTGNLRRQICMGQAGAGEDGQLLSTYQGVQAVNGGNTGLDKFRRIVAGGGVHGQAVDIHALFRQ